MQSIWRAGLRFLFKSPCPLCQRSTSADLCIDCTQQLRSYQLPKPAQAWQGALPLLSWGRYDGTLKRAIAALKYQNQPQVAEPLGIWLGETWQTEQRTILQGAKPGRIIVVPIPLHRDREQQRGFNQAMLLAQSFCRVTGLELNPALITRTRVTEAQYTLSAQERQRNLNQAFAVHPDVRQKLRGCAILLLDDIYTTGATAHSAAAVLRAAAFTVLGIAAVAQAQRFTP